MLAHRIRRRPIVTSTFAQLLVFSGLLPCVHVHLATFVSEGHICHFNPLTAKLFNLNFHPPEVVSR